MSWNDDMQTAPKDSITQVLLWYPWTGPDRANAPKGFAYIGVWADTNDDGEDCWRDPVDFEKIGDGATHWQLIIPPKIG